ncbi:MAG TPA: hypothetical protein VGJ84_22475 [Polyangiaceae bacterium]
MKLIKALALSTALAFAGVAASSALTPALAAKKKCDPQGKVCTSGKDCKSSNCHTKKHKSSKPKKTDKSG